ncbi:hypothetical protein EMIT0196P_30047 [Pseudomonas chlororaphis]
MHAHHESSNCWGASTTDSKSGQNHPLPLRFSSSRMMSTPVPFLLPYQTLFPRQALCLPKDKGSVMEGNIPETQAASCHNKY